MAIQIHIRIKDSDWDQEHEIAEQLVDNINNLIPSELNIPVLVLPVEDQADEMEDLFKDSESRYLEARNKADKREQTEW